MAIAPNSDIRENASGGEWTRHSALIVALCFVLNMIDGMDLLVISFLAPTLQKEWAVDAAAFAIVFSSSLAGMALGGLGLAPLADKVGRRRMIVTAIALMAASMWLSSYAQSLNALILARFIVGTGIGTVLACIAAISARAAPEKHRNFAVGILQGGYPIGAMITGFVTAWALPHYGWRIIVEATAVISLLSIPFILWIIPNDSAPTATKAEKMPISAVIRGDRRAASIRLWIATICGFMALYFVTSWITKLSIEAGLPETQAIIASAIYNLGAFVGTFWMSVAGIKRDIRAICFALLIASAAVFLFFGGVPMPLIGVLSTAFVMGITLQGGFNSLYPIAAKIYPDDVRATGIGWAFGIGRIGAFTGPLVGGWALSQHLPLVLVFGIFCIPLTIAALSARGISFAK
jgi:AAHS family 4-hydroxybenzoate transporter-like MFS transporter